MYRCVVITGDLAALKTTITRRLQSDLRLPTLIKDDIKEALYDAFDVITDDLQAVLSSFTFDYMMALAKSTLTSSSILFESNLKPDELSRLESAFGDQLLVIFCGGDVAVRYQRYLDRESSRHPAHKRYKTLSEESFQRALRTPSPAMVYVDTTVFNEEHYQNVLGYVQSNLRTT